MPSSVGLFCVVGIVAWMWVRARARACVCVCVYGRDVKILGGKKYSKSKQCRLSGDECDRRVNASRDEWRRRRRANRATTRRRQTGAH